MRDHGGQPFETADMLRGDVHRHNQQNKHQRYRHPRQHVEPFEADQCRDAKAKAEEDHQRRGEALGQAEHFNQHDGHRCGAPGVPAEFGKAEQKI